MNVEITAADEERIERAFWDFDANRKHVGPERDAFKGELRKLLRHERDRADRGFAAGVEAAARLCERVRCRNWDSHECARQIRDPRQIAEIRREMGASR